MRAPVRQIATAHHARCRAALAIFFSPLLSAPDAGRGPRPTVEEGFAAYLRRTGQSKAESAFRIRVNQRDFDFARLGRWERISNPKSEIPRQKILHSLRVRA